MQNSNLEAIPVMYILSRVIRCSVINYLDIDEYEDLEHENDDNDLVIPTKQRSKNVTKKKKNDI